MSNVKTELQIEQPDKFYAGLIAAHEGLDFEQSAGLNARLILILANHVGDPNVFSEALEIAKRSMPKTRSHRMPEEPTL